MEILFAFYEYEKKIVKLTHSLGKKNFFSKKYFLLSSFRRSQTEIFFLKEQKKLSQIDTSFNIIIIFYYPP